MPEQQIEPPTIYVVPLRVRVHRTVHDLMHKHWVIAGLLQAVYLFGSMFLCMFACAALIVVLGQGWLAYTIGTATGMALVYYCWAFYPCIFPRDWTN